MTAADPLRKILVMGVGNALLQDDGVGPRIIEALPALLPTATTEDGFHVELVDAGTIGLALLPQVEDADSVIVVDAAELDATPGTVRVFRDRQIDELLSGRRRSVHEVALLDLFAAAALRGRCPTRRALVAVQPACTDWGLEPSPSVAAAIPGACAAVAELLSEFSTMEARVA
jgi:hydrogenase maturation protease